MLRRYEAEDTPQQQYLHMHFVLQARRTEAHREGGQGPRVVVRSQKNIQDHQPQVQYRVWQSRVHPARIYTQYVQAGELVESIDSMKAFMVYRCVVDLYWERHDS